MTTKTEDINNRLVRMTMGTKVVRNLERPKPLPLKSATQISRHSAPDVPQRIVLNILEEVMAVVENLQYYISTNNYGEIMQITPVLTNKLKVFGIQLEEFYKDQLDKAFMAFRDAAKDEKLDHVTRTHLLELVELRAMQWQIKSQAFSGYFSSKQVKVESLGVMESAVAADPPLSPVAHLGPGEVIKPSGKYPAPTRLQGKNYCKDEVIIRNADSGKVMGIKGRRVHMIEELSETVISFQRVNPGAKERLVQITGPTEEKIILARNLIEDTIKRNASPVREMPEKEFPVGSSSSLNSSASDDLQGKLDGEMGIFGHMDPSEVNYRHTLNIGDGHLYMFSNDFDLISKAKLALDLHFCGRDQKLCTDVGTQYSEKDLIPSQPQVVHHPLPVQPLQTAAVQQQKTVPSTTDVQTPHSGPGQTQSVLGQTHTGQTQAHPGTVQKVHKRPRRISDYVPFVCPPILNQSSGVRIEYSRDFLLNLSRSHAAKAHPPTWSSIAAEFPNIVRQVVIPFDPVTYGKLWKSMDQLTSVIGGVWSDSD